MTLIVETANVGLLSRGTASPCIMRLHKGKRLRVYNEQHQLQREVFLRLHRKRGRLFCNCCKTVPLPYLISPNVLTVSGLRLLLQCCKGRSHCRRRSRLNSPDISGWDWDNTSQDWSRSIEWRIKTHEHRHRNFTGWQCRQHK